MFGKSNKNAGGAQSPAGPRIPTQRVVSLSSQGLSEPEIIKTLREEGYSPLEVDRGMKDALRSGAGARPPPSGPPSAVPGAVPAPYPQPPPGPEPAMLPAPAIEQPGAEGEPPFPPSAAGPPSPAVQPPGPPGFPQPRKDRFAPTVWEDEGDMDEEFMPPVPKEKRIGPEPFLARMDEELPPPLGAPKERAPLPFTEPPLPKGRGDRMRELKDRRRKEVEELTEEISDEKWSDMMNRVQNLEERVEKLSVSVKSAASTTPGLGVPTKELDAIKRDLETQKNSLHETNARIDSLEEVVKGSLAPMIESVKKFSSAVKAPQAASPTAQPAPPQAPAPGQKQAEK